MVYILTGSGGSGKTNLLLNLFKNRHCYRNKFHNLFYFCPEASFLSVLKHPFEKHDKVYHTMTVDILHSIYEELCDLKVVKIKQNQTTQMKYNIIVLYSTIGLMC